MNGTSIKFRRNLTLAKDVIVKVRSWNVKQKQGFTKTAQATHNKNTVLAGAAQPIGEAQVYQYTFPNLTPEQALQRAQSLLQQISQHELRATVDMPGDNLVTTENIVQIAGTGSQFDTVYYPSSILRRWSLEEGYRMTLDVKNHATDSQAPA